MKKVNYFFVLLIVAIPLSSCEKDEDIITQKEQIKIFMSLPQSEELNDELKSSPSKSTKKTEIANGDTVLIHSRGINSFLWSENEYGEEIKGSWHAKLLETDYSNDVPDYPLNQVFGYSGPDYVSQISFKFPEFGLYKISVGEFEDKYNRTGFYSEITFYIKVVGIPGLTGDAFQNNYIFRMEKKHLFKSLVAEDIFVIYYKYNKSYKGYYCWLENIEYYPVIKTMAIKMKKWPYSRPGDDYQYVVVKGLSGAYALNFMGADDQCDGVNCGINDQNATKSSWWDDYNRGIILSIP